MSQLQPTHLTRSVPLTATAATTSTGLGTKGGTSAESSSYFPSMKSGILEKLVHQETNTLTEAYPGLVTTQSSNTTMDVYTSAYSSTTSTSLSTLSEAPTNISFPEFTTANSTVLTPSTMKGFKQVFSPLVTHPPKPPPFETVTDSGVGAILQVLLDRDSINDVTSDTPVTFGDSLGVITTDMQYSIVANVTNLTVDLFVNGTLHGPSSSGNADGAPSSIHSGPYSIHEGILIGIILSLIIFFSVAGNVVVCAAILSDRNLRKTSNYFIISLAVADMLVASMVMSFAVANDILGYWVFGKTFCSVWISLDIMCSTASIVNLCAISLDRYIHIRSPLHYESWVTPLRTCVCISAIWVLSGLMSFVPIHLGWHQLGLPIEPTEKPTSEEGHYICVMELNPWYAVISSMVSFYMPCIVMIAIYLKLYAYARRHVASIKTQIRTPMLQNGTSSKSKQSNSKVADHKAAITLGVIMGTFLFCWTPFFTINIVGAFCSVCIPTVVFQVFTWLGYFNSTLNPIIYSIFNKEFRDAFKRVLSFRRCCGSCCDGDRAFRQTIEYSETGAYGTVNRKTTYGYTAATNNEVTAV